MSHPANLRIVMAGLGALEVGAADEQLPAIDDEVLAVEDPAVGARAVEQAHLNTWL